MGELPMIRKPENGIGWMPDRFRLRIWYPNCGITGRPADDGNVYTWEQAVEVARRRIEEAGDPVFEVSMVTVWEKAGE